MRSRARTGFSLVESLLSVIMLSLCIGIMASLFASASGGTRHQQESYEAVRALREAMDGIGSELRQCVSGDVRAEGGELTLLRVHPDDALLADATPAPESLPRLVEVRYRFDADGSVLSRTILGSTMVVARDVKSFEASLDGSGESACVRVVTSVRSAAGRILRASLRMRPGLSRVDGRMQVVR